MAKSKLMIFCTCAEFKKEFYLKRVSSWFHNFEQINSLKELNPDFYVFNDGEITVEDIAAVDPDLLKHSNLYIRNHTPILGRTSDLCFPGWIRSFKHALEIGLNEYEYVVHMENDVILFHPDKVVSYFTKKGMFCSHWPGRTISDSTLLVMNDKDQLRTIYNYFSSIDPAMCVLVEGVLTGLANWQYVFKGGRLENESVNIDPTIDFLAQIYLSEKINPLSKAITDATVNHVYVALEEKIAMPKAQRRFIPVQCTKAMDERLDNCLHDDDIENPLLPRYNLYGPLTALYAAWKMDKSVSDQSGVGFHCSDMWLINGFCFTPDCVQDYICYNDLACVAKSHTRDDLNTMEYDFMQYDIVVGRRQLQFINRYTRNIISFMCKEFGNAFYHHVEDIVRTYHYDYGHKIWKDAMMDELVPIPIRCNFIAKKMYFDKFCEFFFDVCQRLEELYKFDEKAITAEYRCTGAGHPKIFQRLMPYLLWLFIYRNKLVVKEAGVIYYTDEGSNFAQPYQLED